MAPRGQSGSSCTLNLTVSGSALPAGGVHGGPALCQANPDGSPNPGQCYQPAAVHVLNLSKGNALPKVNISIDGPTQQERIVGVNPANALLLTIRNDDLLNTANNIHVSNHAACPGLSVTPIGNCNNIAPEDTCSLELSSITPYVPCEITVSGSNIANSPATFVAFRDGGGLVSSVDGGVTKVVTETDISSGVRWDPDPDCSPGDSGCTAITDGTDNNDGAQNTQNIVASIGMGTTYAAQVCNDHNDGTFADWYLPAICEIGGAGTGPTGGCSIASIYGNLYAHGFEVFINGTGGFDEIYWSSTENELIPEVAWGLFFPLGSADGQFLVEPKNTSYRVRCVRAF